MIGEISVEDSIATKKFACDLNVCKGACCTFPGGRGAPLNDDEVAMIQTSYPFIKEFLPTEHLQVIERDGLVDGEAGNFATQCVEGKACVFVYYDNDIAKCAFERGFYEKKIAWQKPISCHLFPIRIRNNGKEEKQIQFEYFSECAPALKKGEAENVSLHRFVASPLNRAFGKNWTDELHRTIESRTE